MSTPSAELPTNLVDLLRCRADQGEADYCFLDADGEVAGRLSFAALDRRARAIAAELQAAGMAPGERALLLCAPGLAFIAAFFGSLYAGVVAVPAYPPRRSRAAGRIRGMVQDAAPRCVLTDGSLRRHRDALVAEVPELGQVAWLAGDEVKVDRAGDWRPPPALDPGHTAFLQYTSGSTSTPKGVRVSHGNLMHNQECIRRAFRQDATSVIVGWLPLYHDMGLIGNVLQPLYVGARCVLMAPLTFLQRPLRWLQAISRHGGTTSGGPNFAYDLCVEKISPQERSELDLAGWRVAFNGAEPVRAATLDRFADAFAACGFRRGAFFPCYGLAEATLLVSGRHRRVGDGRLRVEAAALQQDRVAPLGTEARAAESRELVSCGPPVPGCEVAIVDAPTRCRSGPGRVGEIWLRGDSVAGGYWGRNEETAEVFAARLAGEGDAGAPWLRTGDLGFLHRGELFVAGRLKDLIILRGRNYYPQDFETSAASCHPDLGASASAFAVDGGAGEELVVVQEVRRRARRHAAELARHVRRALNEEHEVPVREVVMVPPGGVPRTSSGKVRRGACRSAYLAGELKVLARDGGSGSGVAAAVPESDLEHLVAEVLGTLPAADEPLVAAGLDSLRAVELESRLATELGVMVPLDELLGGATLAHLGAAEQDRGEGTAELPQTVDEAARDAVVDDAFELSAGQRGLWFLEAMHPRQGVYHVPVALRLPADVDEAKLAAALGSLVRRHGALRTTFETSAQGPRQRLHAELPPRLRVERVAAGRLQERLTEESYRPFDLARGPLLRAVLLRCEDGAPVLLLVSHHLAVDLTSFVVLLRDLARLYADGGGAGSAGVADAGSSYAAFCAWQRRWLAGAGAVLARRAAKGWLTPLPEALELPLDRPRPARRSFRAGGVAVTLNGPTGRALGALAARRRTTPFAVLLAAFQLLLARYGSSDDVTVGAPVAARPAPWSHTVGYLVNLLVLRGDLSGDPPFAALVEETGARLASALTHRHLPYPTVVEELAPQRDAALSPFFQVLFGLQTEIPGAPPGVSALSLGEAGGEVDLGPLRVAGVKLAERRSQFDLSLLLATDGEGYRGSLTYDRDLFDATTALRLARDFESWVAAAVAAPRRRLSRLPWWSPAQRQHLLREWNDHPAPAAARGAGAVPGSSLPELFAQRAARTPRATAVEDGERRLSYGRLDELSAALARRLAAAGVVAGDVVAVLAPRCAETVVGLLAVLRSGAAYLPLEPELPDHRLGVMLRDAGAAAVLVHPAQAARLRVLAAAAPASSPPALPLDLASLEAARRGPRESLPPLPLPPLLGAFVIFTSGSTGRPKGSVNTHQGFANRLLALSRSHGLDGADAVLFKTPVSFDISLWEMGAALASGARLVVAPPGAHRDPAALAALVRRHRVSVLHLVASMLQPFFAAASPLPPSLRLLFTAGEAVTGEQMQAAREAAAGHGDCQVINCYGPSETAMEVTWERLWPAGDEVRVHIGRPVANLGIHVVDRHLALVPVGAVGELVIRGPAVGWGYLGRPALSAGSYVPNPFDETPGDRLYRTGDLVRRAPDGRLIFLRRADHQVKLRGYRVEMGEVESALVALPQVESAVAAVHRDGGSDVLVAWVVPAAAPGEGLELALRDALALRLPAFMVPGAFVLLKSLPTLPSGKVDRRALPAPRRRSSARVEPRSDVERRLAAVWRRVLGVPEIGLEDNFFALGGDSIQGLRVVSEARREGLWLVPQDLFEQQTLGELARRARRLAEHPEAQTGVCRRAPREAPLTPIQHFFFERVKSRREHWNQTVWLRVDGIRVERLAAALAVLPARHPALRHRFTAGGEADGEVGGWRQRVDGSVGGAVLTVVTASGGVAARRRHEAAAVARLEGGLDLARGPVFAALLLRRAPVGGVARGLLVLTAHHLVVDGVSWRVLLADLAAELAAPRVPVDGTGGESYAAWAAHLQRRAGELGPAERDYWQRQARTWRRAAPLPVDQRAPAAPRHASTRRRQRRLGAAHVERLTGALARRFHARPEEILLAALARALARTAGVAPLLVDVEGHGREAAPGVDPAATVGWFTALVPVLLEVAPGEGAAAALGAVKTALRGVPGGGLGHGLLLFLDSASVAGRALREAPRAELAFNYLGRLDGVLPEGSPLRPLAQRSGASRSAGSERPWLVEAEAAVVGGELRLALETSSRLHTEATAAAWLDAWCYELAALQEAADDPVAHAYVESDFPLAGLGGGELAKLLRGRPPVQDLYPLTPLQEGMLVDSLRDAEDGVAGSRGDYLNQVLLRLGGTVDGPRLRAAWQRVVERTPVLRTAFLWDAPDRPLQWVARRVDVPWRDLGELDAGALEDFLAADRRRSFDLAAPPLVRLGLARTGAAEHTLIFTHHHLVLDGWSLPRLVAEVLACYRQEVEGGGVSLPARPPFRAYVAWLGGGDDAAAETFWHSRLEAVTEPTPLGVVASTGPALGRHHGAVRHRRLPARLGAELTALGRRHRVTVSTLFQAAWSLLLHRYSACSAVLFGVVVADRPADLPAAEEILGLLLHTVPLRVEVAPASRLGDWLRQLQREASEVRRHAYVPLGRLRGWSAVPASEPLFHTVVAIENYPLEDVVGRSPGAAGLRLLGAEVRERSGLPLSLAVVPGEEPRLRLSSGGGQLDATALHRAAGHLVALLEGMVAAPDGRPAALPVLTAPERHQIVREWSNSTVPSPSPSPLPVHEQVRRRAAATPDAVAVCAVAGPAPGHLSYGDVESRAAALAAELLRCGAGAERVVALRLDPSPEAVVAVLAVWRCGAAFLPLGTDWPPARLAAVLADAGVRLAVGPAPSAAGDSVTWLPVEGSEAGAGAPSAARSGLVAPAVDSRQLAYVLYTSGSSGEPKGVAVSHGSLAGYVAWAAATLPGEDAGPLPWTTPLTFDACFKQFLVPLATGAAVTCLPAGAVTDPPRLIAWARRRGGVRFNGVPSLWRAYLETLEAEPEATVPAPFTAVLLGGEAVDGGLLARTRRLLPATPVWNLYGPTEATANASAGPLSDGAAVTLGTPVAGIACHVLDAAGEPVPVGVAGELWLGGAGLARGYLGHPARTAEGFRPDPLATEPGARLYRTGDGACRLPDGGVSFTGRLDGQLKVRGVRVEPGEVEAATRRHPEVRDAVAIGRDGRLFVYAEAPATLAPEELLEFLAAELPPALVPARCAVLDALPRTDAGKPDRRALPSLRAAASDAAPVLLVDPVQSALAEVWRQVLGVDAVAPGDDFFALGGDSILALQVAARSRRAGLAVTPRQVFENATLKGLAAVATPLREEEGGDDGAPGDGAGPVPLTPIQARFFAAPPPRPEHWNQALLLRLTVDPGPPHLAAALRRLAVHHGAFALRFGRRGGAWWQHAEGGAAALPLLVVDLAAVPARRRRGALEAAAESAQRSLHLTAGPLGRAVAFSGLQATRLLLVAHHLVVDGVSWRVLLDDLAALLADVAAPLPPATPFQRWATALLRRAEEGLPASEVAFWRRQATAPAPRLPTVDDPAQVSAGNRLGASTTVIHALSRADTEILLRELPVALGAQPREVLLAALVRALEPSLGMPRLRLDVETHGRQGDRLGLDLSRSVGWFTAIHPLVLDLRHCRGPADDLRAVGEQWGAVPDGGVGYGVLRWVGGEAAPMDLAAAPASQVAFNYLGQLDASLSGDAPFRLAEESPGAHRDPAAERAYRLEVTARVLEGCLQVELRHAPHLDDRSTAAAWRDGFAAALAAYFNLTTAPVARAEVPMAGDFPGLELSPDELTDLLSDLGGTGGAT